METVFKHVSTTATIITIQIQVYKERNANNRLGTAL